MLSADAARSIFGDVINLPSGAQVRIEGFVELFGEASANPTYGELVDIDNGDKGYIPFFDQCKADGLLS